MFWGQAILVDVAMYQIQTNPWYSKMNPFAPQETFRKLGAKKKKNPVVAPTNDTKKIAKRRLCWLFAHQSPRHWHRAWTLKRSQTTHFVPEPLRVEAWAVHIEVAPLLSWPTEISIIPRKVGKSSSMGPQGIIRLFWKVSWYLGFLHYTFRWRNENW